MLIKIQIEYRLTFITKLHVYIFETWKLVQILFSFTLLSSLEGVAGLEEEEGEGEGQGRGTEVSELQTKTQHEHRPFNGQVQALHTHNTSTDNSSRGLDNSIHSVTWKNLSFSPRVRNTAAKNCLTY